MYILYELGLTDTWFISLMDNIMDIKMLHQYQDDVEVYGCYKCGTINGYVVDRVCQECGSENSTLTFLNALDIINDMHLRDTLDTALLDEEELDALL